MIYKVNYRIHSNNCTNYILLSDFHGSFNINLAKEVRDSDIKYVVIAGDLINGYNWENKNKINEITRFLNIVAERHPIIVALGNHDLFRLTEQGLSNFRRLEKIKNVYPIYNESMVLDNNRFTNFLPNIKSFSYLKQNSKMTIDEILKSLSSFELPTKSDYIEHIVGHNPYHINHPEVQKIVSGYDVIETGHFHDGWIPTKILDANYDKYLDKNIQELLLIDLLKPKNNGLIVKPERNLSRGLVYLFSDGYVLLLPNNSVYFYNRVENKYFKKDSNYLFERLKIEKVPALVISGAVNTFKGIKMFYPYVTQVEMEPNNEFTANRLIKKI